MVDVIKENRFFKTNEQLVNLTPKLFSLIEFEKESTGDNLRLLKTSIELAMYDDTSKDLILIRRDSEFCVYVLFLKVESTTSICSQLFTQCLKIRSITNFEKKVSFILDVNNNLGVLPSLGYIFKCNNFYNVKIATIKDPNKYDLFINVLRSKQEQLDKETGKCIRKAA